MSPKKINAIRSPLDTEYIEQKKLASQNKKAVRANKSAKTNVLPEDVVTLSSEQPDGQHLPTKLKPSQAVTFEEMQALQVEFSIRV
jgi:hypothetical protein